MQPDDPRHGTYAGAQAHRRTKVPMCGPCRTAAAAYMREHRSKPEAKKATRVGNRARSRALWRVAELHRADYEALYAEELRAEREGAR